MDLMDIQFNLVNILSAIANITGMEYAIFNADAELISSTQIYAQRKGQKVHTASLNEVLLKGNIVVNRPGLMPSCSGCRFVNNCPSTIEILSCIKLNSHVIGVISLTSFSQEGHNKINKNIHSYTDMLEYISNLITMFAYSESLKKDTYILQEALNFTTEGINHNFLVINKSGLLIHWDRGMEELFSYCDLYSQTIHQMFPKDIVNWIFSNKVPSQKYLNLENIRGLLYAIPLKINNEISGYILRIEKKKIKEDKKQLNNYIDSIISVNTEVVKIKKKDH